MSSWFGASVPAGFFIPLREYPYLPACLMFFSGLQLTGGSYCNLVRNTQRKGGIGPNRIPLTVSDITTIDTIDRCSTHPELLPVRWPPQLAYRAGINLYRQNLCRRAVSAPCRSHLPRPDMFRHWPTGLIALQATVRSKYRHSLQVSLHPILHSSLANQLSSH